MPINRTTPRLDHTRSFRSPISTCVVAGAAAVFLVAAGMGYRTLARDLDRTSRTISLAPELLAAFPREIDGWRGLDREIEAAVARAADVESYISRTYRHENDGRAVGLWVAFGIRARDLMPHRPEVCYPGAGWTLRGTKDIELTPADVGRVRARILEFSRGDLQSDRITVLNYFVVDGETCEDVELLRSKAWRGQATIHYAAQVQIICARDPLRPSLSTDDTVREFAGVSFAPLTDLFDQVNVSAAQTPDGGSE